MDVLPAPVSRETGLVGTGTSTFLVATLTVLRRLRSLLPIYLRASDVS
jgi:hypothetical protein